MILFFLLFFYYIRLLRYGKKIRGRFIIDHRRGIMTDPAPGVNDLPQKEQTMKRSIFEGAFAGPSLMFGDNYLVPFALFLGASTIQVGILSSIASFIAPSAQIIGSRYMKYRTRQQILIRYVLAQALIWIPIIILGIVGFFVSEFVGLPWILLGLVVLYQFFGGFVSPSWVSLMGDIVPNTQRGRYFGRRNMIVTAISLSLTVGISFVLDWINNIDIDYAIIGFLIIFTLAFIGRGVSSVSFRFHYDPPFDIDYSHHLKFIGFIRQLGRDNFGRFTLMITFISFAQWISAPFFSPYMINALHFSYSLFTVVNISSAIFSLFVFRPFGRFADRFGNLRLLIFGSIFIPIVPFLWAVYGNPFWLIFAAQLVSGIGWTAFNLASSNFIYDNIPISRRGEYVAYYSFIVGIGSILGGLCGSFLIPFLPTVNSWHFRIIFIISGALRILPLIIFLPKLKEVGSINTKLVFSLKDQPIYRWLYDIRLREKATHKKQTAKK